MTEPEEFVQRMREQQSKLVNEVMELEKEWPEGHDGFRALQDRAYKLLEGLKEMALEVQKVFLAAPVTALNDPKFAWIAYEISNARLNVTFLLLFGVNAHHSKIQPAPKWQGS